MSSPAPSSAVLCGPWATPGDVPSATKTASGLTDDSQWLRPLLLASELLWMLSGRRWLGTGCTETAVLRSVAATEGRGSWPYSRTWGACDCWAFGTWDNGYLWPPIGAFIGPHILGPQAIRLPRNEVQAITSVTIGGDPFTNFELTADGWLRRTDGGHWPVCGDQAVIVYTYGTPPPQGGIEACVALATELAKDMYNIKGCQLPQRVTSISREGVTMTIVDPQQFLDKGRVGLYLVDLWLGAVNPKARTQRATIWSPDLPVTTRQGTT